MYINKPSLVPTELQLFKWGHFHIFSLSYNLTSDDLWPWYMTFDCMNIWRFLYYINNQVWFKSDHNFTNEAIFTFSAYLSTWPQVWKVEPNVNPFHNKQQQQTTSTDNNRGQSDPYVSFLLRQATQNEPISIYILHRPITTHIKILLPNILRQTTM